MKLQHRVLTSMMAAMVTAAVASADMLPRESDSMTLESHTFPYIHVTDLFHPPNDPDDHWDLATVYALAAQGHIDLKGVVIDSPPHLMDPAIVAVAQLNHITGLAVPVAVGSSLPYETPQAERDAAPPSERSARDLILKTLRECDVPVTIGAVGSCRDVALAAREDPALFAAKCRYVAICAGTGSTRPQDWANRDYNSQLDLPAYRAIFDLPCPVYWHPCVETHRDGVIRMETYGTTWYFRQGDVLDELAPAVQNFFLYALQGEADQRWLAFLSSPPDPEAMGTFGAYTRGMWSTALILHVAGLHVLRDGSIAPVGKDQGQLLYSMKPIVVQTSEVGVQHWEHDSASENRFIFQIEDLEKYRDAMTRALRTLLSTLGR